MGQALCGSHTTTEAVRLSVQRSEGSVRAPARLHGISPMTFQKWRNRTYAADARMERKAIHSAVIPPIRRRWPVALCRHMLLLPVNVCLNVIEVSISHLTRSALHRCRPRQDIRRLPDMTGNRPAKPKFKTYLISCLTSTWRRSVPRKQATTLRRDRLHLQVRLRPALRIGRPANAVKLLESIIEAVPHDLRTILTDNSILSADLPTKRRGWTGCAAVDSPRTAAVTGFRRLTQPNLPWSNGRSRNLPPYVALQRPNMSTAIGQRTRAD